MASPWWHDFLPEAPTPRDDKDVSDETLTAILDGAGRMYARYGVNATRMSKVAAESRVSKPTLYRYVTGRADLLERYLTREISRIVAAVLERHDLDTPTTATVALVLAEMWLATWEHPVIAKAITDDWEDTLIIVARAAYSPTSLRVRELLTALYERAGVAEPDIPVELAMRTYTNLLLVPPYPIPAERDEVAAWFRTAPVPGGG